MLFGREIASSLRSLRREAVSPVSVNARWYIDSMKPLITAIYAMHRTCGGSAAGKVFLPRMNADER